MNTTTQICVPKRFCQYYVNFLSIFCGFVIVASIVFFFICIFDAQRSYFNSIEYRNKLDLLASLIGFVILSTITTAIVQIFNFLREIPKKERFIDTNGFVLKTSMKINLFLSGGHSLLACFAVYLIIILPQKFY